MRLATRTFLWSFVPFALLLLGSFWSIQKLVQATVRDGIRSSLRNTQASISRARAKDETRNSRFLKSLGDNASLKAGLQLLMTEPNSPEARLTVEDQLRDVGETLGIDFVVVSDSAGAALAGVMRSGERLSSMDVSRIEPPQGGFLASGGHVYQVTSTPINQGEENLGALSIGERFDLSEFGTPAVLAHDRKVLKSSIPHTSVEEVDAALRKCAPGAECELRLNGETYVSLPVKSIFLGNGYELRTLQSIDAAGGPVQSVLRDVFLITGIGTLLATVILTVVSSRSIVRPIARVVSHLRETEKTGLLPEFRPDRKVVPIHEIRELTDSFNHAARAIQDGRESLHLAYVEFVGSLASALDARDRYTAGHSRRVSELSCGIARALNVSEQEMEQIRIGALLHDIGKIGIEDRVLQKADRLSSEELALIQQHPTIGRRILEGVGGFQPYLAAVELHHEDWNGTGYPRGLRGEETPLAARIVHVADAYDAMTSDRPYRKAMSREKAIRILIENAGTQFDPIIVTAFIATLPTEDESVSLPNDVASIQNLQAAVERAQAADCDAERLLQEAPI